MVEVICFVVVAKERMIEAKLQNDRNKRKRDGEQRQYAECPRGQLARINGHQYQPERAVDHAPDSEDQGVLNRFLDLVVNRGCCSVFVWWQTE